MRLVLFADPGSAPLLRIAGQLGDFVVVTIGPDPAAAATLFAQATAVGASQCIRIWDDELAPLLNEPLSRELVQATLLAAVGRRLDSRFFIVADTETGWLGPALAEELDAPHVSAVIDAQPAAASPATADGPATILVRRRCLHGVQRLRGLAIGVLCVIPGSEPPVGELPSAPVGESWGLVNLGLHSVDLPRSPLRPLLPERSTEPPCRSFPSLAALAERLRQDGLLPTGGGD
jgi:hypothetical protein